MKYYKIHIATVFFAGFCLNNLLWDSLRYSYLVMLPAYIIVLSIPFVFYFGLKKEIKALVKTKDKFRDLLQTIVNNMKG